MFTLKQTESLLAKLNNKFELVKDNVQIEGRCLSAGEEKWFVEFQSLLPSDEVFNSSVFQEANLSNFKIDGENLFLHPSSDSRVSRAILVATNQTIFLAGLTISERLMTDREFEEKFGPLGDKTTLGGVDESLAKVCSMLKTEKIGLDLLVGDDEIPYSHLESIRGLEVIGSHFFDREERAATGSLPKSEFPAAHYARLATGGNCRPKIPSPLATSRVVMSDNKGR